MNQSKCIKNCEPLLLRSPVCHFSHEQFLLISHFCSPKFKMTKTAIFCHPSGNQCLYSFLQHTKTTNEMCKRALYFSSMCKVFELSEFFAHICNNEKWNHAKLMTQFQKFQTTKIENKVQAIKFFKSNCPQIAIPGNLLQHILHWPQTLTMLKKL